MHLSRALDAFLKSALALVPPIHCKGMYINQWRIGESGSRPMRGTLSKTRLFGPSHWMCYFDQVHILTSQDLRGYMCMLMLIV